MRRLGQHAARIVITVLMGGFLGATLVRLAPGFGVDEAELDPRRSATSIKALRETSGENRNIFMFYVDYLARIAHGDLGVHVRSTALSGNLLANACQRRWRPWLWECCWPGRWDWV